jgi:hypothetical protein
LSAAAGVFVLRTWLSDEGLPYWALSCKRMLKTQAVMLPQPQWRLWAELVGRKFPTNEDMVLVPVSMVRLGNAPKLFKYWGEQKAVEVNFAIDEAGGYVLRQPEVLHGPYEDHIQSWKDPRGAHAFTSQKRWLRWQAIAFCRLFGRYTRTAVGAQPLLNI